MIILGDATKIEFSVIIEFDTLLWLSNSSHVIVFLKI